MPRLRRAANRVCCRRQRAATSAGGAKPLAALAIVVSLPVLHEGSEVVLFLYGIFASGASGTAMLFGGLLGVAARRRFHSADLFRALSDSQPLHFWRRAGASRYLPSEWRRSSRCSYSAVRAR